MKRILICHNDLPLVFQQAALPRGKVIGGTFAMNDMIYQRGSQDIFNEWEVKGAKGWGFKNVLPYFVKSVDTKVPELSKSGKVEKKRLIYFQQNNNISKQTNKNQKTNNPNNSALYKTGH